MAEGARFGSRVDRVDAVDEVGVEWAETEVRRYKISPARDISIFNLRLMGRETSLKLSGP